MNLDGPDLYMNFDNLQLHSLRYSKDIDKVILNFKHDFRGIHTKKKIL
jgi:hypothetical protein